jgi:hypothetical protein
VAAGDPEALLAAALELSFDRERAEGYGAAGRRFRTEVLDADAAIDAFERVIGDVVQERNSSAAWPRHRS